MSRDRLAYTDDPSLLIRTAREGGLTDQQIIDRLTSGATYPQRRAIAKRFANAMGLTEAEFIMKAGRRG